MQKKKLHKNDCLLCFWVPRLAVDDLWGVSALILITIKFTTFSLVGCRDCKMVYIFGYKSMKRKEFISFFFHIKCWWELLKSKNNEMLTSSLVLFELQLLRMRYNSLLLLLFTLWDHQIHDQWFCFEGNGGN